MFTVPRNRIRAALLVLLFALLGSLWWFFLDASIGSPPNPPYVILGVSEIVVLGVLVTSFRDYPIWVLAMFVFVGFASLTLIFSAFYWEYGQYGNFNLRLSHLDAFYFTLGTLSTAGTGNIVATSEATRAVQSIQMVVDFGYILVVAGVLVSRLTFTTK